MRCEVPGCGHYQGGIGFGAEQKLRVHQHERHGGFNAGIESSTFVAAALVIAEQALGFRLGLQASDKPCAPGKCSDTLRAQGSASALAAVMTDENLAAAGRIAGAGGMNGSGDGNPIDFRNAGGVDGIEFLASERLEDIHGWSAGFFKEGDAHGVRAGFDGNLNFGAFRKLLGAGGGIGVAQIRIFLAADGDLI